MRYVGCIFIFSVICALSFGYETQDFALSKKWLNLLYYEKGVLGGYKSRVVSQKFFLTSGGMTNPILEFNKSVEILKTLVTVSDVRKFTNEQKRFICSFPMRLKVVADFLKINIKSENYKCPEIEAWKDSFEATGASIIFASQFLTNPASAVGHTYLRLKSSNQVLFLNKVVGYSAYVPEETNALEYVYKGVMGGFKGSFSIDPFYIKYQEYSNIEQRDLWEYELNLTSDEIDFLLYHLWELTHFAEFEYLFMTRNCSELLLKLIEVIRPDLSLTDKLSVFVIPIESIKVLYDFNLVAKSRYYPSITSKIDYRIDRMNDADRDVFYDLIDLKDVDSDYKNIEVVDTALEYFNYNRYSHGGKLNDGASRFYNKLLVKRARLGQVAKQSGEDIKALKAHDASGVYRLRTSYISSNNSSDAIGFELRPIIHSFDDRPHGYLEYSEINLLKTSAYFVPENTNISLNELEIFAFKKIVPYKSFSKNKSWGISATIKNNYFEENRNSYFFDLDLFGGVGKEFYNSHHLLYFLIFSNFKSGEIENGSQIALGFRPGVFLYFDNLLMRQEFSIYESMLGHREFQHAYESNTSLSFFLNNNWSLFFKNKFKRFQRTFSVNTAQIGIGANF